MNPTRRLGAIAVAALIGLGGSTAFASAGAAVATPAQSDGAASDSPAPDASRTRDTERRVLDIERRTLDLERRVVSFDGRSERVDGTDVTVSLDADVLFEFDEADLSPAAEKTLKDLSGEIDDTLDGDTITVVGHTDSKGTDDYNQKLSEERAQTVRGTLTASLSESPLFDVVGRGASEPVADNEHPDGSDDPEGRRRNRRVVVTYTAKAPSEEPGG